MFLFIFRLSICFVIFLCTAASNPVYSSNRTANNIAVGQLVLMSCSVTYNATLSTLSPSITWSGQPPFNPSDSNSPTYVSSTLLVPVIPLQVHLLTTVYRRTGTVLHFHSYLFCVSITNNSMLYINVVLYIIHNASNNLIINISLYLISLVRCWETTM